MMEQLQANPFEKQTYERLVDFGHTFSPSLEAKSDFLITHGDAVAIDIALSAALSLEIGMLELSELGRILGTLLDLGLPIYSTLLDVDLCREALECASLHRGGSCNLVVPEKIGVGQFVKNSQTITDLQLSKSLGRISNFSAKYHVAKFK